MINKNLIRNLLREFINENLNNELIDVDILNQISKGDTFHDRMNPEYFDNLKNDIKQNGIKEPLIYQYNYKDNSIFLKEGHHRLKIANLLELKELPIKIMVNWNKDVNHKNKITNPPIKLDIEKYNLRNYYPTFIKPSELGLN